jgi:hypothetical protein
VGSSPTGCTNSMPVWPNGRAASFYLVHHGGSNPLIGAYADVAQLAERRPSNSTVEGSSPFVCTMFNPLIIQHVSGWRYEEEFPQENTRTFLRTANLDLEDAAVEFATLLASVLECLSDDDYRNVMLGIAMTEDEA